MICSQLRVLRTACFPLKLKNSSTNRQPYSVANNQDQLLTGAMILSAMNVGALIEDPTGMGMGRF